VVSWLLRAATVEEPLKSAWQGREFSLKCFEHPHADSQATNYVRFLQTLNFFVEMTSSYLRKRGKLVPTLKLILFF